MTSELHIFYVHEPVYQRGNTYPTYIWEMYIYIMYIMQQAE